MCQPIVSVILYLICVDLLAVCKTHVISLGKIWFTIEWYLHLNSSCSGKANSYKLLFLFLCWDKWTVLSRTHLLLANTYWFTSARETSPIWIWLQMCGWWGGSSPRDQPSARKFQSSNAAQVISLWEKFGRTTVLLLKEGNSYCKLVHGTNTAQSPTSEEGVSFDTWEFMCASFINFCIYEALSTCKVCW